MRYADSVDSQADYVERQSVKPKYHPCPQCGKNGKRKRLITHV